MSLTRDALEAAIDQQPDDASRYAVLGDWCLQAGDPRGELISLQLAPSTSAEKKRREDELLATDGIRIANAKWRWGFVHTLHFFLTQERWEDWTNTQLAPALAHPSCRFLRELVIDAGPGDVALRYLSAHSPRLLTSLSLNCNEIDFANVGRGLSQLTSLNVFAQWITPAVLSLPSLTELSISCDALPPFGLKAVLGQMPSLRKVTLLSGQQGISNVDLEPLRDTRLESLTLRSDLTTRSAVFAIINSKLIESLRELDVSRSGMTEDAAKMLLEHAPEFARLDSLILGDAV